MPISKIKSDGINDAAITTAKLADSSVNSAKIGVDVIAAEDLAANSVTVSEISNGAVTSAKLDTNIDIAGTLDVTGVLTADSNATVAGDFTVDTSTLYVDSANNVVGIGTTIPSSYNSSLNNLVVADAGDSGISIVSGTASEGSLAFADSTLGGGAYAGWINYNHSSNFMRFFTFSAERMRIDGSGFVGIKTTSPEASLHIKDGDNSQNALVIEGDAGGGHKWGFRPGDPITPSNGYFAIRDETVNANRMVITDSGHIWFGGYAGQINNYVRVDHATGSNNGASFAVWAYNGTQIGHVYQASTSSVAYGTTSDYRLKTDIQPMTDSISRVKQLNPVNFEWITDGTRMDGFLAHETQTVVPEAINGTKDAVDDDGNPEYQSIDQSKLVPLLTAALQEAITKIESLEERIAVLENA